MTATFVIMKNIRFTSLLFLFTHFTFAQQSVFEQKMKLPIGQSKAATAMTIAQSFVGQSYEAHTLEQLPESLVCNLNTFDCYTFVESVLALTEVRYGSKKYSDYQKIIQKLRYRNGQIDGYASRLHYFSEWIEQAQKNNFIQDVTIKITDNEHFDAKINFMTQHRKLYAQLSDDLVFEAIGQSEQKLSKSKKYYLPKNKINENFINEGDIIGITSNTPGLDFNHEGFAIRQHGRIYLLHASSDLKRVTISKEPLVDYLRKVKKHSGIVVLRLVP
jgi:Protein of unknown function (DUF1460)